MAHKQTHKWLSLATAGMLMLATLPATLPAKVAEAAPNPPPGSWPFYRYDMQRTNRVPPAVAKGAVTQPAIKWTYPVGGAPNVWVADITGPNGLPDGLPEMITWGNGRIQAFRQDGSPIWTSELIPAMRTILFVGSVDGNSSVEIVVQSSPSPHAWGAVVLSGATGAVLSRFTEFGLYVGPAAAYAEDVNGDGVLEIMHHGFYERFMHSFSNGASQPPVPVVFIPALNSVNNLLDGTQAGDIDGDGQREVLLPHHRTVPLSITIVSPHLGWSVVTRTIAPYPPDLFPGNDRVAIIVTDTVPGGGQEMVFSGQRIGTSYAFLIHATATPPSYTVTATWHYTFAVASRPSIAVVDLDGGNREVIASYADTQGQLRTQLFSATGAELSSLTGVVRCYSGNLDTDPSDEVIFCDMRVNDALRARAYEWDGSAWTPTWPNSITIYSLAATPAGLDLNGDGVQDLLAYNPARTRLQGYSGLNGALLSEFNFPTGAQCTTQVRSPVPRIVLACSDGFGYVLDNTLNVTAKFYAGTGVGYPYVVDTDANARNEVVLVNGSGALVNLDPYTATQQFQPATNWSLQANTPQRSMVGFWHPVNLSGAGQWAYPIVNSESAPTYTLSLLQKSPSTGVESVLATAVLTNFSLPRLVGLAQLDGAGDQEVLLGGTIDNTPLVALQRSGSALTTFWSSTLPILEAIPVSTWDVDNDGRDELFVKVNGGPGILLDDNGAPLTAGVVVEWGNLPVIGNVDGDPAPEFLLLHGDAGALGAYDYTGSALSAIFVRYPNIPVLARHSVIALADASLSEPGLEIVGGYANGNLYAFSGLSGSDIYSRALGVSFDTGTCASNLNVPVAYLGSQASFIDSFCPGAARFAPLTDLAVADIDDDGRDELLVASENGYLYALNAENGSLLWGYNFYYPVRSIIVANVDNDPELEILVGVTDGFLYALDQQSFAKPLSAWDGPSPVVNDDADVQVSQACYTGHWRATSDPGKGQPDGYRIALRDEGGALMTNGYLNVTHTVGALVMGATLCVGDSNPQRQLVSNLIPGQRYFLEVISYKGPYASAPTFSDGILVASYGSLEDSTKSVTPTITTPGGILTWQVVVRNSTQATTTARAFDPIPVNTTYVPGSASATFGTASYDADQNRIVWSATSSLDPGQAVTITFQTQVNSGFSGGLIQNTAQIVNLDSGLTTLRSAAASVGASNLSSAVKTVDKAQAFINDVLTYTIRLTNTGTLTASGTLVNDPIPAGTSFVVASLSSVGGSGSAFYNNVTKRVTWIGTLAPGQTLELSFRVKVNVANAVLDNCARINDVQNGSFDRCARTVVGSGGPSLLNSFKTSDRAVYSTTDTIVYTVTLVNDGTQNTTVQMRDVVPAGVTVQSASVIPVAGSLQQIGNVVSWTGSIAPGGIIQVRISGLLNSSDGVLVNRAIVTDTTTSQVYTLTREVLVGTTPALNLQKFAEPPSVDVGETITYVLRLENTGNMPASSAVLTDPLPSGTSYVPGSAQASVGTVTYNAAQQRLEWSGPVFLTSPTFITWSVQVVAGAQVGFPIVNVARSYDGQSDVDEAVALTPVNVPAGKALIRAYVYQGATGATGMSGVQVSAAGLATVTSSTDGNGYVGLLVDALVTPTNYAVFQVVPAGFVNLTPNPVGVAGVTSGGVYDVVFRNAPQAPSGSGWVRGVVFNDVNQDGIRNLFSEVGIAGVTVQASNGQVMQTLGDGSYFFLLPAGARTITQTNLAGWQSSTPDVVTVNVTSGGVHEVNFGDWLCSQGSPLCDPVPAGQVRVYGYVYRDADAALNLPDALKGADDIGLPLVEVSVNTGTITDTTDASGMYVMDVPVTSLPASVELPVPPAGTIGLSPQAVGVDAPAGYTVRVDFAVISTTACGSGYGIVNGFVFSDTLGDGLLLIGQDGPTLTEAAVTLGSETQYTNWMYAFPCVPAGTGTVTVTVTSTNPAGYTETTPNSVSATVNNGQITEVNFGKAFQSTPIALRYAYVPIVVRQP